MKPEEINNPLRSDALFAVKNSRQSILIKFFAVIKCAIGNTIAVSRKSAMMLTVK